MKLFNWFEDDEVHSGRIVSTFVLAVLLIAVIQFSVWGLGIVTAPWAGRQNVHRIINTPNNIIGVNDEFYKLNGDIATDASNLKTQVQAAERHRKETAGQPDPTGAVAQTQANLDNVVTGTSSLCMDLVNKYNNDAVNYTKSAFRSDNLPAQQDPQQCAVPASK